jgi:cation diffusion facilitator family transporter
MDEKEKGVSPGPVNPATDSPERAAVLGLVINATLATGKLLTGILGHSFALVADAVESMVDIVGSLVVWRALHFGALPPDKTHPFGHGKAEAIAAAAVGLLVIAAGLGIAVEAVHGIITPQDVPSPFTLVALVVVVVVKEAMFRVARRAAAPTGSSAGLADAWHHRSDAITSVTAFCGIVIAILGGEDYAQADDWAALVASAVIIFNGIWLLRAPLTELMDVASPEIAAQCSAIVLEVDGIRAIEQCEPANRDASIESSCTRRLIPT